jgi:hypothetical protein
MKLVIVTVTFSTAVAAAFLNCLHITTSFYPVFMQYSTQKLFYFFQSNYRKRGCDFCFGWYGGSDNDVESLSCKMLSTV